MKQAKLLIIFILVFFNLASAQYLEVRRSATVKKEPSRDALIIKRVQKGEFLRLLDNGRQSNGYYKVQANSTDIEGWIYRTLVRRYEGAIPGRSSFALSYGPVPPDYYSKAKNITGDSLKLSLHNIIKGHKEIPYRELWDILKKTDIDTLNRSNVIGIYSGFSIDADSMHVVGNGWNREHVWAKSRGNFGTKKGAGTDVHHIRVADASTNNNRSNRSFDECATPYIDKKGIYSGETPSFKCKAWAWEPRDKVKGDVARMLFYMAVRYEGEDGEPDLELVDSVMAREDTSSLHGKLSVLLQWHNEDPVDNYERYRNHIVYQYQCNRNPFIDHPEFVERIWGNSLSQEPHEAR